MRCWVDTDIGDNPDDAIALALAARHPDVELVGVSTVGGDVDHRATQAAELLRHFDVNVPIAAGEIPLTGLARADALLAIGPLTNVARVVDGLPARVALMGGATRTVVHRGEKTRVDHNFAADPSAAATVVRAAPQAIVVPLDVTAALCLTHEQAGDLTAVVPALAPHVDRWYAAHARQLSVYLHDPFTLLVLLDDVPATHTRLPLRVDKTGALHVDRAGGTNHQVVTGVDVDEAVARVLTRCNLATRD